jgi:hypothetical protein
MAAVGIDVRIGHPVHQFDRVLLGLASSPSMKIIVDPL